MILQKAGFGLAPFALLILITAPLSAATLERTVNRLGTTLYLELHGKSRAELLKTSEKMIRAVNQTAATYSHWDNNTAIHRWQQAGRALPLPALLVSGFQKATTCTRLTDGYFDINYAGSTTTPDFDGIIKGMALDRVKRLAATEKIAAAFFNFGGQIALYPDGVSRSIAIASPRTRDRPATTVWITGGSLSTSGLSEYYRRTGHLAGDFRNPIGNHWQDDPTFAVTVWDRQAWLADCLSTGLVAMGQQRATAWVRRHPNISVILMEENAEKTTLIGGGLFAQHQMNVTNEKN